MGNNYTLFIMKIIAFYLPQFHEIPENNEWWGENFTEWTNVKKALPIFEGHEQPRIPLDEKYYDLLDNDVKRWQVSLAKEYGIYGFCYYHYWFNGKLLLEKPMEQMLADKSIDLPFCICWANEPWTKAWVGEKKVLIAQNYGRKEEWKKHFKYLLPFLKDERYIKTNGKPLIVIYRPEIIGPLNEMLDYWQELSLKNGFLGLEFAYQNIGFDLIPNKDDSRFEYNIEFQPNYAIDDMFKGKYSTLRKLKRKFSNWLERKTGKNIRFICQGRFINTNKISYDEAWKAILNHKPANDKCVPGAFVGWDNSPRHGKNGKIFTGDSPEKFKYYLSEQIKHTKNIYKKDMIFMYAWNEWAEGGYLEPDVRNEYRNLEAIKEALIENDEFPW